MNREETTPPSEPEDRTELNAATYSTARDDIAAFVFGVTEPEEAEAVRQLLQRGDPAAAEAIAESAAFGRLFDSMLHAAPVVAPPRSLASRLQTALGPDVEAPIKSPHARSRVAAWFAPQTRPAWALAAAAVALLLLTNLWWSSQANRLEDSLAAAQQSLRDQNELERLLTTQGQRTTLTAPESGDAQARLYWAPDASVAVLLASSFPALEPGQTYQVWLVEGDQRTSGALFRVDDNGWGMTLIRSPKPLAEYDAVGITPEPEGGSPGPTAPPVVRGGLSL